MEAEVDQQKRTSSLQLPEASSTSGSERRDTHKRKLHRSGEISFFHSWVCTQHNWSERDDSIVYHSKEHFLHPNTIISVRSFLSFLWWLFHVFFFGKSASNLPSDNILYREACYLFKVGFYCDLQLLQVGGPQLTL